MIQVMSLISNYDYSRRVPTLLVTCKLISIGEQNSGAGSAGDRCRASVRVRAKGRVRGGLALRRLLPRLHPLAAVAVSQMRHGTLLPRGLPLERRTRPPLRMRPRARAAPTRTRFECEHFSNLDLEFNTVHSILWLRSY